MSRSVGCRARVALSLSLFGFLIFSVACSTTSTSSPATGQPASAAPTSAPAPAGGSSAPAIAPAGSAAAGAGAASPSPAVVDEATAKAGIQKSLDARTRAIQAKDDKAYMALIDQENLTWKRVQSEIFRQYVEGIGGIQRNARVTAVRRHRANYYKATIDVGAGEKSQQVWIFTPVDGKWLHTEPIEQELGERRTKETEQFKIRYYEWDNEILDRMIAVSERAHATVTKTLNKTPETKTTVYVSPTFQTHPGRGSHSQAAFFNPDVKDAVYIRSLDSFGSRPPAGLTQEDELLWSLTHEYVHLVNNLIVRIVKMPEWMSEGLAEYVSSPIKEL
ncbi:MAG: hypothetical protein HY329_05995, partial [Chloroflexi bacterium]|nr:hypothetical protein [Chloroflexota bacterium]